MLNHENTKDSNNTKKTFTAETPEHAEIRRDQPAGKAGRAATRAWSH
jgi:hypothetical protein